MKSIINNNINCEVLPEHLNDMIDYESHKMKFKDTLYVIDTVNAELSLVNNILLTKVQAVSKDELVYDIEDDEKYNFIFIKYLYYKNGGVYEGTRFIQEMADIEFD